MAKKYTIEKAHKRSLLIDSWLVKFEKKAFGWIYYGSHTNIYTKEIEKTVYKSNETITTNEEKTTEYTWLHFKRISPYSSNPFFILIEAISNIVSFFRRIGAAIVTWVVPICLVLGIILSIFSTDPGFVELGLGFAFLYAFFFLVPSLILAIIGKMLRTRRGGVDDKLKKELRDNGYDDDLEDI